MYQMIQLHSYGLNYIYNPNLDMLLCNVKKPITEEIWERGQVDNLYIRTDRETKDFLGFAVKHYCRDSYKNPSAVKVKYVPGIIHIFKKKTESGTEIHQDFYGGVVLPSVEQIRDSFKEIK